ncbi:4Fe-4S binding protein [Thermodesulfobacteriota bacterium]
MKQIKGIRAKLTSKSKSAAAVKEIPVPNRVVLPLDLPWGRLSALVHSGERVAAGQRIASHPDGILPPLRASIPGTISQISPWVTYSGNETRSILIDSDGVDSEGPIERLPERKNGKPPGPGDMLKLIFEAGIRERDTYAWPLPIRIAQPALTPPILFPFAPNLRKPVEYLILNGIDRQPGVVLRRDTLNGNERDLMESIEILKKLCSAANTVLAVSRSNPVSEKMERNLGRIGVEIVKCPDKYPIALEPMLVRFVTGREIPMSTLDARSVGVVVVDVITALRALNAVRDRLPPHETVVQLTAPDHGINIRIKVREGTLLEDALTHIIPKPDDISKIILGGPFLGYAQHDMKVPLIQEVDSIILQGKKGLSQYKNESCINCGYCVRACPVRLVPSELSKYCEYGKFRQAEKEGLFACIECGICAYVCPTRRPMIHLLRFGKQELTAMREE